MISSCPWSSSIEGKHIVHVGCLVDVIPVVDRSDNWVCVVGVWCEESGSTLECDVVDVDELSSPALQLVDVLLALDVADLDGHV